MTVSTWMVCGLAALVVVLEFVIVAVLEQRNDARAECDRLRAGGAQS